MGNMDKEERVRELRKLLDIGKLKLDIAVFLVAIFLVIFCLLVALGYQLGCYARQGEIDSLSAAVREREMKIGQLTANVSVLAAKNRVLQSDLNDLSASNERLRDRILELEEELSEKGIKIATLECHIRTLDREIIRLGGG